MEIGRRKFFSFFGTGVAMLAAPELFIPKKDIVAVAASEFAWVTTTFSPEILEAMKAGNFTIHATWALAS